MADINLFQLAPDGARELPPQPAQVEKALQTLFEHNLETLLGIRFLASEHSTGPVHGGRIDTLGLDEDGSPVIIEYKRHLNENVINQGLFYLDWLMDHRKDFQWLVLDKLGPEIATKVEWSAPRLICIAGDFTRFDSHAVKQINRSIELIRYRRFGDDLLLIEQVHSPRVQRAMPSAAPAAEPAPMADERDPYFTQRIDYRVANARSELRALWDEVSAHLAALGDDVQIKPLKQYYAFKRLKNFVCLELYPQAGTVAAYVKLDPDTVVIEAGFTRDMRGIGHFGTGDLEIVLRTRSDFERAQPLFQRAYEGA